MALIVPNQGESLILQMAVNKAVPQNLVLRLYKNNKTPAETDTEADYTEADFTGYLAATLLGASWVAVEGAPSSISYAQQTFTASVDQATQQIYGYYLTQMVSGKLVWAERFSDAPIPITNNADFIKVTPQLTQE